jgi:Tfp pilus assembly protein PilN
VLPSDVWLTKLSAQEASPAPVTSTTTTTTTTTTTESQAPAPAPAATGQPLSLQGYTYSQEGVARFLTRLAVVPELEQVKLISSAQTELLGRAVYSFTIETTVQTPVAG